MLQLLTKTFPQGCVILPDCVVDGPGPEGDVACLDEALAALPVRVGGEVGDEAVVALGHVAGHAVQALEQPARGRDVMVGEIFAVGRVGGRVRWGGADLN